MQGSSRSDREPIQQLLLAGGGHTHALLLRRWLMQPGLRPTDSRITLVSRRGMALYSGLIPALVAGRVTLEQAAIDLRDLCRRAGVAFVQAEICGLDPARRELHLQGRPPLRFDRLSLDVGAVTAAPVPQARPVKPLEPFLAWLDTLPAGHELRLRGGGPAAVELALALQARGFRCRLQLRGERLRLGSDGAARAAEHLLQAAGVQIERRVSPEAPADLACTGSRAPDWLAAAGLPHDPPSGRLLTEVTLQVSGHPQLFACGDCALVAADPRPASGVWAVRAAIPLATNLRRSLEGRPLRPWRPQPRALQLLGDAADSPRAIACWGPWSWGPSRWLWSWKQRIDQAFIAGFQQPALAPQAAAALACRGCAAKLPARPLAAALQRLDPQRDTSPVAEDAALLARLSDGRELLQSVDGFPALVEDPWLNARLTTLHACSDLWACGARVDSVQAVVTVPRASAPIQEELLLQSLAGVRSLLDPLGARLIGGHSLEGRDGAGLGLALVVNGLVPAGAAWTKGPLRPGDRLLLSRPIGSGVLFAAAMAGAAPAPWLDGALELLQQSQHSLVPLLAAHDVRACTDITGFGLLGHLGEMLGSGGIGACRPAACVGAPRLELELEAVPALPGSLELLARGYASSLAPANAAALALLEGTVRLRPSAASAAGGSGAARLALLVDPQTCGPLLAAVPAARAEAALAAMRAAGFAQAALIGRVLS
ncbi:MAG: selenide, water dikinase SelD [Synechococcaceae cyanobacterium]|nr:selenide, water dikinase SelD [Synechococcaceae cyanobacterium]